MGVVYTCCAFGLNEDGEHTQIYLPMPAVTVKMLQGGGGGDVRAANNKMAFHIRGTNLDRAISICCHLPKSANCLKTGTQA